MIGSSQAKNPAATPHPCRLVSELHGQVRVVTVVGYLDWSTVGAFRDLLQGGCTDPSIVVDLDQTEHIDSAGNGALVAAALLARRRRQRLVVVTSDPLEREVLDYIGLSIVIPVVTSQPEALNRLNTSENGPDGNVVEDTQRELGSHRLTRPLSPDGDRS